MNYRRSSYWDNIKGILIILVVFAHCIFEMQNHGLNNILVDAIYYVHMPAFIFVSGYFSSSERSRSRHSLIKFAIAYLFMISIYIAADVYRGRVPHILSTYHSEWYLMALIFWRLLSQPITKHKAFLPITLVFALLAGFWPDIGGNKTLAINKIVTFFPFFLAGYYLAGDCVPLLDRVNGISNWRRMAVGGGLLLLVVVCEAASHKLLHITEKDLLPHAYTAVGLRAPTARAVVFAIASMFIIALLLMAPSKKIPFITKFGRNSFSIFLIHRPITLTFEHFATNWASHWQLLGAFMLTVFILVIFGSDHFSSWLNAFMEHCTCAVLKDAPMQQNKEYRVNHAVLLCFGCAVFLVPIVAQFLWAM